MSVVIETTLGDITVDLYTKERPKSCLNFLKLCKLKRYNLCLFHVVQPDYIAQTSDPQGSGKGGDSVYGEIYGHQARYYEAETNPRIKHTKKGLISMVNYGNGMLGSQFFLTLGDELDYLDGEHCVFGELVEGWETLDKINTTICDGDHRPYQDIRITHTVVLHDPYDDPAGFEPREHSPEPDKELLASSRIGADEDINDYAGKSELEINEMLASKEAKARATILEMVGDLPDANVAPPENVLFVCKLNPVTNDDDLQIIFSRFGEVKSCEVIRDKKTGESLQYAFIEFKEQKSCEDAYFKMDNVLIDDRRIHVDFSQSVAKFRWKGKGRLEVLDEKAPVPGSGNRGKPDLKVDLKKNPEAARRARSKSREARKTHRDRSRSRDKQRQRSKDKHRQRSRSKEKERRKDRSRDREDQHQNRRRNEYYHRDRSRSRERKRSRDRGDDRRREDDRKRRSRSRDRSRREKENRRDDRKRRERSYS